MKERRIKEKKRLMWKVLIEHKDETNVLEDEEWQKIMRMKEKGFKSMSTLRRVIMKKMEKQEIRKE